jgi:hypothetical protein
MALDHDRITAEARGRLRVFKKQAKANQVAIDRLLPALSAASREMTFRSSLKGRARVFDRLQARMAKHASLQDARLEGRTPLALWAYLKPREAVLADPDEPGQMQDCVTVEYVLAGAVLGPDSHGRADGLWTLEASDHALLRLLTRSPGTDLSAVLFDAHRSLLALPEDALRKSNTDDILIAAGDGVFICEFMHGQDISLDYALMMYFRAKTWLHMDQLFPISDHSLPHRLVNGGWATACCGLPRCAPSRREANKHMSGFQNGLISSGYLTVRGRCNDR